MAEAATSVEPGGSDAQASAEPHEIEVRYFASAADAAGRRSERMTAATVGDVRASILDSYGEPMARVLAQGSFLVDGVVGRDDRKPVGTRVDVLPPFAGG